MNRQKSYKDHSLTGTLYLVPTPIGNLEDISFRALKVLKDVDWIASEDTRNTQKLLNYFNISTNQISFHEHNTQKRIPEFLEKLERGESIAQVSDAGMPSISDPGNELVQACIRQNIPVISLPGATAGVTALIASGLSAEKFTFIGFLPRKKSEQKKYLKELSTRKETLIVYESPYRVKNTLKNMLEVYPQDHPVVLCRELTKIHEEYIRGTLTEVLNIAENEELKGECCLLIGGSTLEEKETLSESFEAISIKAHVELLEEKNNMSSKEAIKEVAKLRGLKKQEVYKEYHNI
ncbi:16S rRNA (cytidine(1402)-2'-O)-methyltransferase [Vagococcus elongatus]|uniref:Ribosomal RNA small subunit methyltransferase I n=1 Tax=Vagococcus elongatus TaxID=180344 RepID=A0A430ANS3_9ENTE|nr:16S rRNA (cytidine(1402)-2'-O)-methyltransferase [Vagococcus elongatus]RSU09830.1 16S rRNA (cytidine(1402)-2'-O)-methyltransferase [Vagococcus elongatus]